MAVTGTDGSAFDLFQLWSRNGGYWKLIAFHVDGYRAPESVLQLHPLVEAPEATPAAPTVPSDPVFAATAASFLQSWFIDHSYDELRD